MLILLINWALTGSWTTELESADELESPADTSEIIQKFKHLLLEFDSNVGQCGCYI